GYQFIAPLTDRSGAAGESPTATAPVAIEGRPGETRARRTRHVVAGLLGAAALIAAGIASLFGPRSEALRDRDSAVLGGLGERSGEPVFDFALRQGLAAQLSQSPFLNIVPDERVREALRLMGRSPDDHLDHVVGREACRRLGVKAMLEGSIASLGQDYVV